MEYNRGVATKRIYYDDAFVREFEAEVLACTEHGGNSEKRWRVLLDRTALYPASGGQPDDRGKIGTAEVVEIVDEGEEIGHFVDRPVGLGPATASTFGSAADEVWAGDGVVSFGRRDLHD